MEAKDILLHQDFSFRKPQTELLQSFYPILASMILDDLTKTKNDTTPRTLDDKLKVFCEENAVARKVRSAVH